MKNQGACDAKTILIQIHASLLNLRQKLRRMLRVKKLIKRTGIVLGILIILLVLTAVILPQVVDPNDYKDRIVAFVEKNTGRQLKIEGDIALSVFPWLGVNLGAVELGNAEGFEAPMLARVEQLQIRVRLLPLLSKMLEADVVFVRGLSLNLERNKDGRTNWDNLARVEPQNETGKGVDREAFKGALAIGGINIREASVTWIDRISGHRFALTDLSFRTSAVTLVDPVDIKLRFVLNAGSVGLNGQIESNARISINPNGKIYKLENLRLKADLKGEALPGGAASIKGSGALSFDAVARRFQLDRWKLEAEGISLPPQVASGAVEVSGSGDLAAQTFDFPRFKAALTVTGDQDRIRSGFQGNLHADLTRKKVTVSGLSLEVPEFSIKGIQVQVSSPQPVSINVDLASMTFLVDNLKITGKVSGNAIPGGSMPVVLSSRMQGDLHQQTVSIDPFLVEALGVKAGGNITATKLLTSPEVIGALTIRRFNLRETLARIMKDLPKMGDPKALSSAEVLVTFSAAADSANLDKIAATVDDSRLTGSAAINNFASPDVRFDLAVDRLKLDRYLPPKQREGVAMKTAAASTSVATAGEVLPVESLRNLSLNGKLRISELIATNVKMANLLVTIHAKDGVIRMDPLTTNLYNGSYTGAVKLDLRGPEAKIDFGERLAGITLKPMLKDLGIEAGKVYLDGPTSLDLNGSVAIDPGFKVVKIERMTADGNLGGKLPFRLDGGGTLVNLNDQTLTADLVKVAVGDMDIKAKTKVSGLLGKPAFNVDLSASTLNLRQVLSKIGFKPLETFDPKAMSAVKLAASIKGSADTVSVDAIKGRLDDSLFEGSLGISFKPSPEYVFDIRLDDIDLDRYLPPTTNEFKRDSAGGAGPKNTPATAPPLGMLRELNLEGKVALGKAKIANVRLQEVNAQVRAKDGLVSIKPLRATLYGGSSSGSLSIDTRGKDAQLSLEEKLSGVQAGPLLKDIKGRAMLTGLTNLEMTLTASGADTNAITRTLNGSVTFQITDGSIEKLNIAGKICKVISAYSAGSFKTEDIAAGVLQMVIKKPKGNEEQSTDRTEFSEMHGSILFANGIGTNKDLMLKSPLLRLEGAGKLDLPNQLLDYQATAVLVKSCEGQGGKSFTELANYPIPVSISGPLDNLDVKPNLMSGIFQILQRRQAKEQQQSAPQPQPSGPTTSSPPQRPEEQRDGKRQAEDVMEEILQKGLQNLFKKKSAK